MVKLLRNYVNIASSSYSLASYCTHVTSSLVNQPLFRDILEILVPVETAIPTIKSEL